MIAKSKYYFLVDLVLVMKFPPTTSAKVPGSTAGHGWVFFFCCFCFVLHL